MSERRCRYCQESFQPSKFHRQQQVCGAPECQKQRRTEYHKQKIATDSEYREVCRDSPRKWRARNPGYWKRYREERPVAAERNRQQQQIRDQKLRLRNLANNTSALDIKHSAAKVWLVGDEAVRLANNNPALAKVWVIEALPLRSAAALASCKQHPSGSISPPAA
jgi:hypothetical protein